MQNKFGVNFSPAFVDLNFLLGRRTMTILCENKKPLKKNVVATYLDENKMVDS